MNPISSSYYPHIIIQMNPSYDDLVKMVFELNSKCNTMESQIDGLIKFINNNHNFHHNPNITEWLNINIMPNITFIKFIENIHLNLNDLYYLMEHSLYEFMNNIWLSVITTNSPIKSYKSKLYVYDYKTKTEPKEEIKEEPKEESKEEPKEIKEETRGWHEMQDSQYEFMLKKIRNKMLGVFLEWKNKYQHLIDKDISLSNKYNKAVIKLMDISLNPSASYYHIRTDLYNACKRLDNKTWL